MESNQKSLNLLFHTKFIIVKVSIFCLIIFFLVSCRGKFVPDPIDPDLPKYSAKGHDTAGAMVNGKVWRAVIRCGGFLGCSNEMTIQPVDSSSIEIRFEGEILDQNKIEEQGFGFSIILEDVYLTKLKDLEKLSGMKYDLGNGHYAYADEFGNDVMCTSSRGQLFFNEIELKNEGYIIAGTFGFVIEGENCKKVEVYSGRFDYWVGSL